MATDGNGIGGNVFYSLRNTGSVFRCGEKERCMIDRVNELDTGDVQCTGEEEKQSWLKFFHHKNGY